MPLRCRGSKRKRTVMICWRDGRCFETRRSYRKLLLLPGAVFRIILPGGIFRIDFDGKFHLSPLFQLDLVPLGVFESVFDAYFLVEIIGVVDGNFRFLRDSGSVRLDDFAHRGRFLGSWFARHGLPRGRMNRSETALGCPQSVAKPSTVANSSARSSGQDLSRTEPAACVLRPSSLHFPDSNRGARDASRVYQPSRT